MCLPTTCTSRRTGSNDYPKNTDNYIVVFPQSIELHRILLEIIGVSTQVELNKLRKSALIFVLIPEGNIEQWNNALLTIDNIFINVKKTPNVSPKILAIIDRISMVIHLRLSLDDYH